MNALLGRRQLIPRSCHVRQCCMHQGATLREFLGVINAIILTNNGIAQYAITSWHQSAKERIRYRLNRAVH